MKKSSVENSSDLASIQEPITKAPLEVKQVIERVLKLEKDKLYLKTPRNINDDILNIIKSIVQWSSITCNCVTFVNFMAKHRK